MEVTLRVLCLVDQCMFEGELRCLLFTVTLDVGENDKFKAIVDS